MIIENNRTYFIGSIRCREVIGKNGALMTPENHLVWLGEEEGHPCHWRNKDMAKHFPSKEAVMQAAIDNNGFPWYYKTKIETLKIYFVQHIESISEHEVTL